MQIDRFDVTAPAVFDEPFVEATILGATVWLWMHSQHHRRAPLAVLSALLLPAIKHGQFVLVTEQDRPVFYTAWANFDAAAEARYIANPPYTMPDADWNCGDRLWLLDWVAPFGHSATIGQLLGRLFPAQIARALDHRGNQRGLRVIHYRGIAVLPTEARYWADTHPITLPAQQSA